MLRLNLILFLIISLISSPLWAMPVTTESWAEHVVLKGSQKKPVVISPLPKLTLSDKTQKVVILPEELDLKEEYQEFRLFRNRYVIFGIYIFTSLYYNWLTRNRR